MIATILAFVAAGAAEPPVPRTVNDIVLGEAADFESVGPAQICTDKLKFVLRQGERAYLEYSGIHDMRIAISGKFGVLKISEGDAWAKPRNRNGLVLHTPDLKFYDVGDDHEYRYLAYGKTTYSDGDFIPLIWVDGDALIGNRSDRKLLRRLELRDDTIGGCSVTYGYGWDVVMDGAPIIEKVQ